MKFWSFKELKTKNALKVTPKIKLNLSSHRAGQFQSNFDKFYTDHMC